MSLISDFVGDRLPPDLYDAYLTPLFETWSDVLVARTPPKGGVLDVACGTGIVSRKLASIAGVTRVEAIDIAGPMVEKAKALTRPNVPVAFQVASADQLPFEDNCFTAAFCQQGLQFFPSKVDALKEIARVVEPGGKLTFAIWTSARDGNPVFGAFEEIVSREFGEDLVPFGPFSFGDSGNVERVATQAGLRGVSVERLECVVPLCDPRTLILFDLLFLGRPGKDGNLRPLFDPSDTSKDVLIEELISKFEKAVSEFQQSDGTLLAPSTAHLLVAEVTE